MKQSLTDQKEAKEYLLQVIRPGDTVYTILRHLSRSGMMRRISPVIIRDGKPIDLSWQIARLGLWPCKRPYLGLVVSGCGMDMGSHIVFELGKAIFPDTSGYALKQEWL